MECQRTGRYLLILQKNLIITKDMSYSGAEVGEGGERSSEAEQLGIVTLLNMFSVFGFRIWFLTSHLQPRIIWLSFW